MICPTTTECVYPEQSRLTFTSTHSNFHGFFFFPWLLRRARFGSSWCHICVFKASLIPIYDPVRDDKRSLHTTKYRPKSDLGMSLIFSCARFFPLKGALCVHRLGRVASFGKPPCFRIWYIIIRNALISFNVTHVGTYDEGKVKKAFLFHWCWLGGKCMYVLMIPTWWCSGSNFSVIFLKTSQKQHALFCWESNYFIKI